MIENIKTRIVMLCGNGRSSRIMYYGLADYADIECVIIENRQSKKIIIKRRMKRLGIVKTFGQILFMLINKVLAEKSKGRIKQLMHAYGLVDQIIPSEIIKSVDSVNCDKTINIIKTANPDAIVVNGTRIISKKVLSSVNIPFVNTHMGITPRYRGVHGGYWALAKGDYNNCGVTIHLVDKGIDTGGVLYQDVIRIEKNDNFNTYPIHQIAKAIPMMKAALKDIKEKRIIVKQGVYPSRLWYQPTIFEYVKNWIINGIK